MTPDPRMTGHIAMRMKEYAQSLARDADGKNRIGEFNLADVAAAAAMEWLEEEHASVAEGYIILTEQAPDEPDVYQPDWDSVYYLDREAAEAESRNAYNAGEVVKLVACVEIGFPLQPGDRGMNP